MKEFLKILFIEDDEVDRSNIQRLFDKSKLKVLLEVAVTLKDGIDKLKTQDFDCVLLDYYLPDSKGAGAIEDLRKVDENEIPLIVLTGMGNETMAAEVMKKGAADYVSKNGLNEDVLERSVRNAAQIHEFREKAILAERALLEREKQYRTIIETVSDIIFRLDVDGNIEFVNPAIRFLGYEPSEIVGQPIDKFVEKVEGVDYEEDLISKIKTQGVGPLATNNLEVNLLVEKDSTLWEQNRAIPVLLDAFGLWDVPDEVVFKRDSKKNFLGTLCIARNITEVKAMEEELLSTQARLIGAVEELKELATRDALTGIANRRFFDEYLEKEWKRAQRDKYPFSLVMIDLDFFKVYNDTYGHQKGDVCLKEVATAIDETMKRPADMAARYGGEEFALILPETSPEGAMGLAEKLRKSIFDLNLEHKNSSVDNRVTVSMGVATLKVDKESNYSDLITKADKALYAAKNDGRNRVTLFNGQMNF
ncbi:MAG: diguanylate cyclase [Nitrospina sp.]|jgi:diguanylate cyclase (GGDEF)-like protein|nr:diguanylate cyclase [Nitrospina sp.]